MLEDQHPNDDLGRCARAATAATVRPARLERVRDDLNHGLVLEQRVDFDRELSLLAVIVVSVLVFSQLVDNYLSGSFFNRVTTSMAITAVLAAAQT